MKNLKSSLIIIILFAILILLLTAFAVLYQEQKKQNEVIRQTQSDILEGKHENLRFLVKLQEFKDYLAANEESLLNKLIDSLKVKPKNVIKTINNSYHHFYPDTTQKGEPEKVESDEGTDTIFKTTYNPDQCIKVDVKFSLLSKDFTFEKSITNYESETLLYQSRETKKGKKIFWPLGKKKIRSETLNNCAGKTQIKEIEIIKR